MGRRKRSSALPSLPGAIACSSPRRPVFVMAGIRTTSVRRGFISSAPLTPAFGDWAPTTSIFQLHGFDALTPVEEVLGTLDDLVRAGKIRYIGVSNFSGWHLMKSLGISESTALPATLRTRPTSRSSVANTNGS